MTELSDIPAELAEAVAAELDADEKINWARQPIPGKMARKAIPLVIFGVVWTAISLAVVGGMFAGSLSLGRTNSMPSLPFFGIGICSLLFDLPFLAIGVFLLSSPYWNARSARQTVYVVTSRRAIIFSRSFWKSTFTVRTFEPRKLGGIRRNQSADGSGDLILAEEVGTDSDGDRTVTPVGFMAIPDVKQAERCVRELVECTRDATIKRSDS